MTDIWKFHSAGEIVFGLGAVQRIGELARQRKFQRVLIVTDAALVRSGAAGKVEQSLKAAGIATEIFSGGEPEPSFAAALKCLAQAKPFSPDALVGLGGGSNMDLSKITAVCQALGGHPRDYVGDCLIKNPILPVMCVPTTAGTGSEVTASAVLTDNENAIKVGVLSEFMRPAVAVVDPELTVTCPAKVTADSGIDALTHAIEALTAINNAEFPLGAGEQTVYQGRNPISAVFAERAIELVGQHLETAVHEPTNLVAREGMAAAALLAGLAFSNSGVALVHAMEYPVGGAVHCSHGAGNGLLLPFVMQFNAPTRQAELATVARRLGEDVTGLSEAESAQRAITAVESLKERIGIPMRLRELGVTREQLPAFAEKAFGIKRILRVNPRMPTQAEIQEIFEAAW